MTYLGYFMWFLGIYVVIGICVTLILAETPYAENPWIVTIFLWPLYVYAFLR